MNQINQILKTKKVMVLDGALATELEQRNCNINDSLWSAKILAQNPEIIKNVHYDYFMAGADCAITSSYQATIEGFVKKGYTESEAKGLIKKSVFIAKKARDEFWLDENNRKNRVYPIIAASVGPYGAYLSDGSEYVGNYSIGKDELKEFHRDRIKLLIDAGADILACETIPSLTEALALAEVISEFEGVNAWISFSCRNQYEISDGTLIGECTKSLNNFKNIISIGINCTAPQFVESLIKEVKIYTDKPIVVYPNSGEEYDANSKNWYGYFANESYGELSKTWHKAGASIIGGCCRTTPHDISQISNWVKEIN